MGKQLIPEQTNGPYFEDGVLYIPEARIVYVKNEDGSRYEMPTSPASGGGEIDGGSASSTYQPEQIIDCGDANG